MRGTLWLTHFFRALRQEEKKHPLESVSGGAEWTEFMGRVMDGVGKRINCRVARRRKEDKEYSGEYLNVDAFFIDGAEYAIEYPGDPLVLPRAVVELENRFDPGKISSCLWKILCVRSPIRALICYQQNADKVIALKTKLEDVIWRGSLMKGTDGDLLVIIGDETVQKKDRWSWPQYFTVFEWRNDRLEEVKI